MDVVRIYRIKMIQKPFVIKCKIARYDDVFEPKRVEGFKKVIDAQSSGSFSVVLCESDNEHSLLIISLWCRLYPNPTDLLDLLLLYTN